MYKTSTNYFKKLSWALVFLILAYTGSRIFHSVQRQTYLATLENALASLAVEQEIYFSTHFTYTSELVDLHINDAGPLIFSLVVNSQGWSGIVRHEDLSSEDGCATYFGTGKIFPLGTTAPQFPGDIACTP